MALIARIVFLLLLPLAAIAEQPVVNIYAWTGEIPETAIQQFEKETGIKVNFSTYENNEVMYAKLRANKHAGYDLIMPSSNIVDRMSRQDMLEPLDKTKLSNWKNINPSFLNPAYDPKSQYSVPVIWGLTGIFFNTANQDAKDIQQWSDLWDSRFKGQLLLLDDIRDVFSVALYTLGYSINDTDPEHIKAAYLKLKELMPNVKMFSTDTVVSIIIDEDTTVGTAWNGDVFKAFQENPNVRFVYPKEGFSLWVDNIAIPKNAPHPKAAHAFINFILRPEIAKEIALYTGYPIANLAGQHLLPSAIRDNPMVYPSAKVLQRGRFITDISTETLAIYEKYWEELKMGG